MPIGCVKVASGGLAVSQAPGGFGAPFLLGASGLAVTVVPAGGLPIADAGGSGGGIFPPPVVYAAFDPGTTTDTALTGNNLTATHTTTNANSGARVLPVVNTGKFYFEIKLITGHGAFDSMGLLSAGVTYTNFAVAGAGANTLTVSRGGNVVINGTTVVTAANMGAFVPNDVCGIAVDHAAHKAWVRRNAGNWNANAAADPVAGTNSLTLPSVALAPGVCFAGTGTAINDAYTANFGASAFANAVPSGFTAGWPA